MNLITRLLVLFRYLALSRQAREMRAIIGGLPASARAALGKLAVAEIEAAAREPQPHLHGSVVEDRYQPWGDGAGKAFERARSSVAQLKLRGIALWLAVVFHETRDSPHPSMQALHRDVLGFLGLLKGTYAARAREQREQAAERAAT